MRPQLAQTTSEINRDATRVTYRISGFDRLNFVSDIAEAVPQDGSFFIIALCFEGDGVRVNGWMAVQTREEQRLTSVQERLRAIRGVVNVQQVA